MVRSSKASPPSHPVTLTASYADFPAEAILDRVTQALSEMGALDALVKVILAEGRRLLKARDIYLLLREDGQLVLRGALGLERDAAHPLPLAEDWGLEGRALRLGQPVFAHDAEAEPDYRPMPGRRSATGAFLAVPLRLRRRVIGVVAATRSMPGWFTEREAHWLAALAQIAAVAIENERLRAAEQQQAKLRAREEFLAVVSHELKTPVAVIKAYVEVLLRRAADARAPHADIDVLQSIHEQADRMLAMIDELLDFQRLEQGQLRLELSRFDLGALAERVVSGLQLTSASHRLQFVQHGTPLMVLADRKRIEEVLTNLVDNATKYSPPGSQITIEVCPAPESASTPSRPEALLIVSDQGVGVPAEEQSRIFERFYQASGTPVRGHIGLGLGLYISREIVQRHGGRMWVESAPGKGSRFFVALPLAEVSDLD